MMGAIDIQPVEIKPVKIIAKSQGDSL